jgi:hypothetical protein
MLGNVPVALLAVIGLRFLCCHMDRQQRGSPLGAREARSWRHQAPPTTPAATFGVPPSAAKPDSWRKLVRAPVVEEAWSRFAGSIIQEVRPRPGVLHRLGCARLLGRPYRPFPQHWPA